MVIIIATLISYIIILWSLIVLSSSSFLLSFPLFLLLAVQRFSFCNYHYHIGDYFHLLFNYISHYQCTTFPIAIISNDNTIYHYNFLCPFFLFFLFLSLLSPHSLSLCPPYNLCNILFCCILEFLNLFLFSLFLQLLKSLSIIRYALFEEVL